ACAVSAIASPRRCGIWSRSPTTRRRSRAFSASSRSSNLCPLALPPPSSPVVSGFRTDCQARSRASFRLSLLLMEYPLLSRHPPNYRLNGTLREARRSHTRDAPHSSFVTRKERRPPSQMHIFSICAPYNASRLCEFAARQMVATRRYNGEVFCQRDLCPPLEKIEHFGFVLPKN